MTRTPEEQPDLPKKGAGGTPPVVTSVTSRWIVAISVVFGTFMSVLDVTVVNVALPHMMGSFGRTLSEITWVATSYSIAEIIMATMAGWWSTVMGRKRLYVISMAIFVVGSILAGTARNFEQMMLYRTLQGIGGGALIPVSMAILRETFPPREQGLAMALYGMGVVLAPAIGPVLGGWLTDVYGWPWIFYINVPFGIAGIVMVSVFLEDPHYLRRGVRRIDWPGILFLTFGLTGMQVVLERGQEYNWFESSWIVVGAVVTIASLVCLTFQEFRSSEPVINLRLLGNRALGAGSAIGLLFGIALYGSTFLLPAMLQTLLGYDAYHSGLTLLPRAGTIFLMMPFVGWLYNYFDARLLVTLGVALIVWAFWDLAHLSTAVSYDHLVPILIIMGLGMPFQFVTVTTLAISTTRRESMTEASSLYTLLRRIGGNIGYALLATIVERRTQFHRSRMVKNISPTNPAFAAASAGLASLLEMRGVPPTLGTKTANSVVDQFINQQAGMMAYNDASWFVGLLFLSSLFLVALLPGRAALLAKQREIEAAQAAAAE